MAKPWYRWPTIHPASHPQGIKLNKWILHRDDYQCQVNLPPCTTRATVADHIIPASRGGMWFDPNNLRAACGECNQARRRHPHPTLTPTHTENW